MAQAPPPAPGTQKPPAPTTPDPGTQKPSTPPPSTAAPAAPTPAPTGPPKPFPEGAKIAYVNVQAVASNSIEGKAATAKLDELRKKKAAELAEKNKQLQTAADEAAAGWFRAERRGARLSWKRTSRR